MEGEEDRTLTAVDRNSIGFESSYFTISPFMFWGFISLM